MNGIVKLRTLTMKSTIGFGGWFKHWVVKDLIDNDNWDALVSIYYNLGNISFTDEVLEAINITKEYRIEKPGKDRDKFRLFWKDFTEKRRATMDETKLMHAAEHRRKDIRISSKVQSKKRIIADAFYNSKGSLAAKNQKRKYK